MKVLYVSRRFNENICATMHRKAIMEMYGDYSTVIADVSLTGACPDGAVRYSNGNKFSRIIQIITKRPRWISREIVKGILDVIADEKIDVVFIDEGFFGQLSRTIKKRYGDRVRVVTFSHDIAVTTYKERLNEVGLRFLPEYRTLCKGEKLNIRYADKVLVLNQRDAGLMKKIYGREPDGYLSMGVAKPDFETATPKEFTFTHTDKNEKYLLCVGKYYAPNLKGLRWFIENVFYKLPENYNLVIIGRGMEKFGSEYQHERIHHVGGVESLASFYNNADIVVAPVFGGGGMKQKTAEAFAYGRPFVGTIESIQGYEKELNVLHNGKKIVFASDNPDEQIEALKYIDDNSLYGYMEELNKVYDLKYSKKALMDVLSKALL